MSWKDETAEYLREMLGLDPLIQAGLILERRQRFREGARPEHAAPGPGSAPDEDDASPAPHRARNEVRLALDALRDEFWDLAPEQAQARIDALDLDSYPDLRSAGTRLRRVAEHLDDFRKMQGHVLVDAEFVDAFRAVLSAGPATVAAERRNTLRYLAGEGDRGVARKSANVVGEEFPQLFLLETDWLDRIASLPAVEPVDEGEEDASTPRSSRTRYVWPWIVLALLILKACDALLEWGGS